MRILVCWDQEDDAELIALYLNASENDAVVTTEAGKFMAEARAHDNWDAILMTIHALESDAVSDEVDPVFDRFLELRNLWPDCPIIGACHTDEVFRLAKFISNGMRSYLLRDVGGDFVFLLQTTLESTVQAVVAERERRMAEKMREEIDSVRRLQESILPQHLHRPDGYQIAACYEPSQIREMGGRPVILAGGDYYDVIDLDAKNVVLLVGDAAGHGMRACMSIMTMQTLMQMIRSRRYRKTSAYVEQINRQFCEQSVNVRDGSLITLLYGILQPRKHQFQWTSAGHPVPLLQNLETGEVAPVETTDVTDTPLGVAPNIGYRSYTTPLPPRSRLLIYTDGLIEAYPAGQQDNLFGVEGAIATLKRTAGDDPDSTLRALLDDSHAHTQGAGRHDDTSALLLVRD